MGQSFPAEALMELARALLITSRNFVVMKTILSAICLTAFCVNVPALTLDYPLNVLGKVTPGVAGDANSVEQVRFLADKHNIPTAAGTVLGDNPDDPQTEVYTLVNQFGVQLNEDITLAWKSDNSQNSFTDLGTYEYVLAKYGPDTVIWWIGNLVQDGTLTLPASYTETGTVTLPNGRTQQRTVFGGGLSHVSFFNEGTNVPDGGATAVMLGLAMLALGAFRRKS